ncbi:MAG: hypothetical protein H6760_01260 [Candidatus Nomurabacteria bacterium]|nr:MAG: hypothetical protein H6760_01260 [Candidatus Nomurabacteria bacterium]
MTWRFRLFLLMAIALTMTPLAFMTGCQELPTEGDSQDQVVESPEAQPGPAIQSTGPEWYNQVVSEAKYTLCQLRNGTSHEVYQGKAMGDWPYPHQGDCCNALGVVRQYMYGGGSPGPLGEWNGFQQGGWCKFFVNLVLYRSSYGYPGGHLLLPTSTYRYNNPRPVSEAQPGWILQSETLPHTAIVVERLGGGLDVIDSNWIGTYKRPDGSYYYSYAIARHEITNTELDRYDFMAYRPHEACVLHN